MEDHKMMAQRSTLFTMLIFVTALMMSLQVYAQSTSVLTTGLKAPNKIVLTDGGRLVVAETGTGNQDGRISVVDRCGNRRTLLDGLPSGISPNGPSGPSGLAVRGQTLFISIGGGDATVAGPRPGSEAPNPNGPSSPIFSAVLKVDFTSNAIDRYKGEFTLSPSDHALLKSGANLSLQNAQGETLTVKLLADFPDFISDPFTIARLSNTFALALDGNQLYVADASLNLVRRVDIATGAFSTLKGFAPLPNPLPFGPPVIDTVPDGLSLFGDKLLVTFLTGFPFPAGRAEVRSITTATGSDATFISGLTTAIDVLAAKTRAGADQFFVLELSSNMLAGAPGRLLRFDTPAGPPTVLVSNLIGPVGIARDAKSGDIFVTENFTGRIIQMLGNEFDSVLKDETSGDLLRFNSLTGDYLFISCRSGGVMMTGRGRIERHGCAVKLSDAWRVKAVLEQCPIGPEQGSAKVMLTPLGPTYIIRN
jgi:hypothetical protein